MIHRALVWLVLASCFGAAMLTSPSTADAQQPPSEPTLPDQPAAPAAPDLPEGPDPRDFPDAPRAPVDPGRDAPDDPLGAQRDRYRARARTTLDHAKQRLARAESDRAIANDRRLRILPRANLSRRRASQLRRDARTAARRANAAEDRMVDRRRSALEEVRARRAAYNAEVLDALGNRAAAFALAVWLLLMAFLAAGWRPVLAWLALRRAGGLDGAGYARAVAVAAATAAGGAGAALAAFGALSGRAPLVLPVIAGMVVLLGLTAWHSTSVRAGSPLVRARRRLVPGMATGLLLVTGLGIGAIGVVQQKPVEPRIPPRTEALARLAEGDPTARPTKLVARLRRGADRADTRSRQAEARARRAQGMLQDSEDDVRAAERRISQARPVVDRLQRRVDDPL